MEFYLPPYKIFSMKALIINGHKYYRYSKGKLNRTLFDEIIRVLSLKHKVETTVISQGYDIGEEQEKFLRSDVIIYQTPVNWYSIPWLLKKYIDDVYTHGVFFESSVDYGRGGILTGKKYMLSLTMSAPEESFSTNSGFFDGRDIDDIFIPFHKTQEYCGMERIKTFAVYNVLRNTDIETFKVNLALHLNKYIG